MLILVRTLSLPLLFALTSTFVEAQTSPYVGTTCAKQPAHKTWAIVEPDAVTLHRHTLADPNKDIDTASSFEAWRDFEPGKMIDLGICRGTVFVRHGIQPGRLHLTITLKRELPRGSSVADFIQQFTVDSKQT